MKKSRSTHTLIAFLCLITLSAFGQADSSNKKNNYYFWLNTGGQYCFSDNFHSLLGGQFGLNFSVNQQHFIKVKGYSCLATDLGSSFSDTSKPNRLINIQNVSVLFGLGVYKTNIFSIITSAGLSYGTAFYRGQYLYTKYSGGGCWVCWDNAVYDDEEYSYIGLPLEVSFMLTSPFIGTSLDFYANIHKHPDYGLTLSLLIGKIRNKKINTVKPL